MIVGEVRGGGLRVFRFAISSWVQGFCTPTNLTSSSLPFPTGSPTQNGYGTGRVALEMGGTGARVLGASLKWGLLRFSLDPHLFLRHWRGCETP